ncbi:hypothetical protein L249_6097 [Ophiocordyceps polyrhachis-furcata BCC 54312]|uniref:Glutathione hydrolase n=1 Tax=Ophiocordyceps polyrhachis-furcata BCC 54312 TaxID=1330021 RepID=A0A367LJB0_9HYPO|nr:hypothetical protein L249_6097 [Ophiocordyceps polyrhachis-furcata BCC 54312]
MGSSQYTRLSIYPVILLSLLVAARCCHAVPLSILLGPSANPGAGGAVVSEASECSYIGKDLLARGGNAVDAAVGTTFCVGVIALYHSGIGGGGFALVRDERGRYEAVDFRETAPAAAYQDMFLGNVAGSMSGGLSVAVPGEVRGLEYMHGKYGSLPWKTVLQGAIRVARDGFRVSRDLAHKMTDKKRCYLLQDASFALDFAPHGVFHRRSPSFANLTRQPGTLLREGDLMTRKRYARTLERIAEEGSAAFYSGEIAEAMARYVQATNGSMTVDDLERYTITSRPVQRVRYRGLDLYTVGAPASGVVGLSILKAAEQYAPTADAGLAAHRFVEAMRFGYGVRARLADPDFVPDVVALEEQLLDERYARHVRQLINDNATLPVRDYHPGFEESVPESHGTSHIVTADADGRAVSLTTTINLVFGAQLMEPLSGIVLNDEMNDFSIPGSPNDFDLPPSTANYIAPLKRPLSSITPIIASDPDGSLRAVVGASGGSRIISATVAALWHLVEHGTSMAEAVRAPRMHDQLIPNVLLLEYAFNNDTADALAARGHNISRVAEGLSAVQGIRIRADGSFEAAAEPRQSNSRGYVL